MSDLHTLGAAALAQRVRDRQFTATAAVRAALARIDAIDDRYNSFTAVTRERALARAAAVDAALAAGAAGGPLAGVPFAVKNLFDLAGLPTLAGSKINREQPPAAHDAVLVRRLEAAGAVCVGALNMDEYAYGFTTENAHYGASRNPHDVECIAGGSSGGSATAVAAGLVPLTLGSDTNGSIRVPASLCGLFGLKPTYGRLPRTGSYLFAASFDHLGSLARSAEDLALAYDALQGPDAQDPACAQRAVEPAAPTLAQGASGLRIAVAGGWYAQNTGPEAAVVLQQAVPFPPVVPQRRDETLRRGRRHRLGGHAGARDPDRPDDDGPERPAGRGAALHGPADAADLLHRPAGSGRTGAAARRPVADRRADRRRAVAGGPRAAGGRGAASRWRGERAGGRRSPRMSTLHTGGPTTDLPLNDPAVVAEVQAVFARYEDALVHNKVEVLDELFWDSPTTVRFGIFENLYGHAAIKAFRAGRSPAGLQRSLQNTVITTYGDRFATAMTEFRRAGSNRIGRQSQTWMNTPAGWRCVAAHVSLMMEPQT